MSVFSAPILTIDGPSGAGKGTVSRSIARKLGWHYLDSGAIYRALAIAALDQRADLDDGPRIATLAQTLTLNFHCAEALTVLLDEQDITARISTETTGNAASKVAAHPEVRTALLQKQRNFQQPPGLVADGRDMGTVIFPNADYKVFLTASPAVRAQRRYKQLNEKGINANLNRLTEELEERDRRDRERDHAPLAQAGSAVLIDSSSLTVTEVIERVTNLIRTE